jgi:hypothetical protein
MEDSLEQYLKDLEVGPGVGVDREDWEEEILRRAQLVGAGDPPFAEAVKARRRLAASIAVDERRLGALDRLERRLKVGEAVAYLVFILLLLYLVGRALF